MLSHPEIPWPADPDALPRDEHGHIVVGRFYVYPATDGQWAYADDANGCLGLFDSAYDAVNEGALRDDYREES